MMNVEEIKKALYNMDGMKASSIFGLYGAKGALLVFLNKLEVLRCVRRSVPIVSTMIQGSNFKPPPNSIELAVVSLNKEYLQFVPKSKKNLEDL